MVQLSQHAAAGSAVVQNILGIDGWIICRIVGIEIQKYPQKHIKIVSNRHSKYPKFAGDNAWQAIVVVYNDRFFAVSAELKGQWWSYR